MYSPESELRNPLRLIGHMAKDLIASRELAWRLIIRDISSRYRQSAFGILWAFLPPIISAVTFIMLTRASVFKVDATPIPYPAFVLFGTVLWQLFTESLNAPLRSVNAAKSLLAKVNFPREAIIIAGVGLVLFDFAIRSLVLVAAFVWFHLPFTPGLLLFPLAVLALVLLGTVMGLLLTPLGVLYNDVGAALSAATGIWFFLTPVVYPAPKQGVYAHLVALNPVTPLLIGARDLATRGTLASPAPFMTVALISMVALFLVWALYRLSLPILIERMSA